MCWSGQAKYPPMKPKEIRPPKKDRTSSTYWQGYKDSNLDKQNQNLVCYHYTISLHRQGDNKIQG